MKLNEEWDDMTWYDQLSAPAQLIIFYGVVILIAAVILGIAPLVCGMRETSP